MMIYLLLISAAIAWSLRMRMGVSSNHVLLLLSPPMVNKITFIMQVRERAIAICTPFFFNYDHCFSQFTYRSSLISLFNLLKLWKSLMCQEYHKKLNMFISKPCLLEIFKCFLDIFSMVHLILHISLDYAYRNVHKFHYWY